MPPFGQTHPLLGSRHRDTIPPDDGADPSDGQLATWSDALKGWIAADPVPAGVTVHGLLTGLGEDDHEHYALADKSRPSPWVAAADLSVRSLADLGTIDHHLLTGRDDDDHQYYARNPGRAGGQTLYGGTGSHEHLTLHATLHATPGYIRLEDDLQLLSDLIRDSGGNARLALAATPPHVALTGDLDVSGKLEVGPAPFGIGESLSNVGGSSELSPAVALYGIITGNSPSDYQLIVGLYGGAQGQGTPAFNLVYGLFFQTLHASASACMAQSAIYVYNVSSAAGTGAITIARGLHIALAQYAGSKPTAAYGIDVEEQGNASVGLTEGLHIDDQTGTTVRLLELGPAVPYLRLAGGANPAANVSNLSLKLGATLKLISEYDADSAGVGYRALRVPN